MQFDNAESWQKLVCNTTAFEERVDTESLTDPNHLQAELCNASFNGDNVMEILLDLIEFNTFLQKVKFLIILRTVMKFSLKCIVRTTMCSCLFIVP